MIASFTRVARLAVWIGSVGLLSACSGGAGPSSVPLVAGPLLAANDDTLVASRDWPTYGHDMTRTSLQPASTITEANVGSLHEIWRYRSATLYDKASPILANGIVYAVDAGGNLAALDANSGAIRWQRALGDLTKLTPSLYDGHLIVGTLNTSSQTATSKLYSLDPQTGAVQWQRTIDGGLHGPPVAVGGRLYVPVSLGDVGFCHPGGIYVFDEATGDVGIDWLTGGAVAHDGGAVWSPVSYDGSRIYFGTGNTCVDSPATANAIVAMSTALSLDWSVQTGSPMTDDDVGGGVLSNGRTAYVNAKNGSTYALDPATGRIAWRRGLGAPDLQGSYATPALAGSTLITSIGFRYNPFGNYPTGTQFGTLFGLNAQTGTERWRIDAVAPFINAPAIVGNIAFTVVDADVVAIDATTGKSLWSVEIETNSRSQPIVAEDKVYAMDNDGDLYAYGFGKASASADARTRSRVRSALAMRPYSSYLPKFCRFR